MITRKCPHCGKINIVEDDVVACIYCDAALFDELSKIPPPKNDELFDNFIILIFILLILCLALTLAFTIRYIFLSK